MECLPSVALDTDCPYWISREEFFRGFDQADFQCRNVQDVTSAYLDDWFLTSGSKKYFYLPTVQLVASGTQFISGRHRTVVLLRYLEEIPVAFETRFGKSVPSHIAMRKLDLSQSIVLPDLPFLGAFVAAPNNSFKPKPA